jgi:actin-related protein 9
MFPGTKPGEWEPVRIRNKVATKKPAIKKASAPAESPPRHGPRRNERDETSTDAPLAVAHTNGDAVNGNQAKTEEIASTDMKDVPSEAPAQVQEEAPKPAQPTDAQPESTDIEMKEVPSTDAAPKPETQDTDMPPATLESTTTQPPPEELPDAPPAEEEEAAELFEDDPFSSEGAIYPIVQGRIENWSCFFALLSHIYNMINPPFHMPVLFVAQPCWTSRDYELITQYVFENWKIPAFCLMDAALTATYAYGVPTALVVDVGYEKCDVTAVTEFSVSDVGRGIALEGCGGQAMTKRLQQVLEHQGFDEQMAEQLKKSSICEILPAGTPYPKPAANGTVPNPPNPAATASTGALDSGLGAKDAEGLRPGQIPRGPGPSTAVGEENGTGLDEDDEGVLDVAAIVARDNAAELLAKREREKAEKAAAKKGGAVEASRIARLRNSERDRATFTYVDYTPIEESGVADDDGQPISRKRKREIEVGIERFMAATPATGSCDGIIDTVADAIHHAVLSVHEISQRTNLWDNLIILGNGSRIRGMRRRPNSTTLLT